MESVWLVEIEYPQRYIGGMKLVNGISDENPSYVYGVYATEELAREIQEQLADENAHAVLAYDEEPIEICVSEWRVEK